ncbi:MAG: hypothetical protein NUV67_03595 [archaeon]|nr:hypothetical protein [archaeon]
MDKEQILKDSVRKLLELGIADKEILENLKSVGVDEPVAKKILANIKAGKESAKTSAKSEEDMYANVYEEMEEPDEENTPVVNKPIKNPAYSGYSAPATGNISELWEKGILATVDSKLHKMEDIQKDIDSVINAKIDAAVKREIKKAEAAMESQRELFDSKIDASLRGKSEEIKKVIEARAKSLEDLHTKVQADVAKAQGEKRFNQELMNGISEKLAGLDAIRSQMISDTNKSIIQMQSGFEEFMDESKKKRDETEARVNRTLQLESKITEGLIEDAKQKMENLQIEKEGELTQKVQEKIRELDEMVKDVDPQAIVAQIARMNALEQELVKRQKQIDKDIDSRFEKHLSELDNSFKDFKKEISKIEDQNFEELRKEYGSNLDDLFAKHLVAWDKAIKAKEKEFAEIKKVVDPEKFNATMESLDMFKQQFVNTVAKSIQDYNKSKKEVGAALIERDKKVSDYLKQIDTKINELSEFQKRLIEELGPMVKQAQKADEKKKSKN